MVMTHEKEVKNGEKKQQSIVSNRIMLYDAYQFVLHKICSLDWNGSFLSTKTAVRVRSRTLNVVQKSEDLH